MEPAAEPKGKSLPPLDESDAHVRDLLMGLMGKRAPFFVSFDGFARRFVTTVDNLAKEQASPQMWPVIPTSGQFEAEVTTAGTVITARNATRYTPFVRFAEMIDTRKAVGDLPAPVPAVPAGLRGSGRPGRQVLQ